MNNVINEEMKLSTKSVYDIKNILAKYGIYLALAVICVIISLSTDNFFTVANALNVVRQVSFNGIIAIGMTFVIIIGGIDLSVGSVLALVGIVTAMLVVNGHEIFPLPVALLLGLLFSAFCGYVNGICITKGKLAPFIVTMGTMTIARGLCLVITNGRPVTSLTEGFRNIGAGFFLGIPIPIYIFAGVVFLAYFALNHTRFGRYVYAVGGNELAAKASGIDVDRIKLLVYVICGLLSGVVGMVLSARINSASPVWGVGYELDAIAAAVIGGTSLSGGTGTVTGTIVGALIIGIISNGLDLMNVSPYYQQVIKGLIIIVAVLLDRKGK